jgi:hypothetical protein
VYWRWRLIVNDGDRGPVRRGVRFLLVLAAMAVPGPVAASPRAVLPTVAMAVPQFLKASHAVRGVITRVDNTTLTIARSAQAKAKTMVFVLDAATVREGALDVGATVSIRYRKDGKRLVATAIEAQPAPSALRKSS